MKNAVQIKMIEHHELGMIRPLFKQVFGTDLSDPMLAWKYGQGRGKSYGSFAPDGTLLAHCGILYRDVLADGRHRRIAQLGDLMALPGRYGGLSRSKSPFALLIQRVLDDLPDEHNPDALAFGFPSDRAMRLGEHLGLFASIDRMYELTFVSAPVPRRPDRCTLLEPTDRRFKALADRLWRKMADGLGADLVGIRDARYLLQRYFQHPQHSYSCHLVTSRWFGSPLGLLITRMQGDQCELLDIIAPPNGMHRLLLAARQHMPSWGAQAITLWLTEHHTAALQSQASGATPLEFRIMANPHSSRGDYRRFADRWWLTGGDTDYH